MGECVVRGCLFDRGVGTHGYLVGTRPERPPTCHTHTLTTHLPTGAESAYLGLSLSRLHTLHPDMSPKHGLPEDNDHLVLIRSEYTSNVFRKTDPFAMSWFIFLHG